MIYKNLNFIIAKFRLKILVPKFKTFQKMSFQELVNWKKINEQYQKPNEFKDKTISYGTAGFRTK